MTASVIGDLCEEHHLCNSLKSMPVQKEISVAQLENVFVPSDTLAPFNFNVHYYSFVHICITI